MLIRNKDVIQSYLLTTARYDFNVYEKRILYRLVEMCQDQLEGKKLNAGFTIDKLLFDDCRAISMPISAFLVNEDDKNYSRVKDALERLNSKRFEYEDDRLWKPIRMIEKPVIIKYGDIVKFELHAEIYEAILSFAKGYRKFELKTAMSFESAYTMRFYELFSEQKNPITYTIEHLKMMFNLETKYIDNATNFLQRVIIPAKEELNKKSPYSFEFSTVKTGRKITAITFFPVAIPENRDANLETKHQQKHESIRWNIDKIVIDYLKQNYLFETHEIKNNTDLFKEANARLDLLLVLSEKKREASSKRNAKAWIIGVIKKKLQELK